MGFLNQIIACEINGCYNGPLEDIFCALIFLFYFGMKLILFGNLWENKTKKMGENNV